MDGLKGGASLLQELTLMCKVVNSDLRHPTGDLEEHYGLPLSAICDDRLIERSPELTQKTHDQVCVQPPMW